MNKNTTPYKSSNIHRDKASVTLVEVVYSVPQYWNSFEPALSYFAEELNKAGIRPKIKSISPYEAEIVQGIPDKSYEKTLSPGGKYYNELEKMLLEDQPDIVGITSITQTWKRVLKTIDAINYIGEKNQNIKTPKIVLGGRHVNGLDDGEITAIMDSYNINSVFKGTFLGRFGTLINEILNGNIKQGEIIKDEKYPFDLNKLVHPYEKSLEGRKLIHYYFEKAIVFSSILCNYHCSFCPDARKGRIRFEPDFTLEDIEWYTKQGKTHLFFGDPTLVEDIGTDFDRVLSIIDGIKKKDLLITEIDIGIRADFINRAYRKRPGDLKRLLQYSSFVNIGMESIENEVLKEIGKGETSEQIIEAINVIRELNITPISTYPIGWKNDTKEKVIKNFTKFREYAGEDAVLVPLILTPYKGTHLRKQMQEEGYSISSDTDFFDSQHETFKHNNFKKGELFELAEWLKENIAYPKWLRERLSSL